MPHRSPPFLGLIFLCLLAPAIAAPGLLRPDYDLKENPSTSQSSPAARVRGAVAGDGLGRLIRTGDVNGDGKADLIASTDTGKIHVWLGAANFRGEFDAAGTAGAPPQFTVGGFAALRALVVGDVNGDGRADLILGFTPMEGQTAEAGIIFGRTNFPPTFNMTQTGSTGASVLIQPGSAGENLAAEGALTLGDLNDDGRPDIILGAPAASPWERSGGGVVYVILGRTSYHTFMALNRSGSTGYSFIVAGASAGDGLTKGGNLHTADVNGDGTDDLIMGAWNADGPGESRPGAGEVYVVAGRSNFATGQELDLGFQFADHGASLTLYGAFAGDGLSESRIASGDVNGDGIQDLVVGAPGAEGPHGSRQDAGQAYVVLGRSSLPLRLDMRYSGSASPDETQRGADLILYGANAGDRLTDAGVAAADVNADGLADLIAGSLEAPNILSGGTAAGQIHVVFGRRNLASQAAEVDAKPSPSGGSDLTIYGARQNDRVGQGGLFTADINGDGIADIITGSDAIAGGGGGSRPGAGRAYIILGRGVFPEALNLRQEGDPNDGASVHLRGADDNDGLTISGSIALGDLNGDGDSDLVVSAPAADGPAEGRANAGELYVIHGVRRSKIRVLDATGVYLPHQKVLDLGRVGLNTEAVLKFTVNNSGRDWLYLSNTWLDGADAKAFQIVSAEIHSILPGGSKPLELRFKSGILGRKKAGLRIGSNDATEDPLEIELELEVVKAVPPTVTTLGAEADVNTAKVSGMVNPRGDARRVFVDFGVSPNLDRTAEVTPAPPGDSKDYPVSMTLANLYPHTRYAYRFRSSSSLGSAVGTTRTFVTGNTPPTARDDTFTVTGGGAITLYVTANDDDPDADPLTIATFTQPTAGKVAKSGSQLIFTAPLDFTTGTSFTYSVKDGQGSSSGVAAVTIVPGAAVIDPVSATIDAEGRLYSVAVTTDSLWSVSESVPWIEASVYEYVPPSGISIQFPFPEAVEDTPKALVEVAPNLSTKERSAVVMIAGQAHQVVQKGVSKPILALPETGVPPAQVGKDFAINLVTGTDPAVYTVNSPAKWLNIYRGYVSGIPTSSGTFPVTVTARNAAGATEVKFDISVNPLHPKFAGSYLGFVTHNTLAPSGRGGRLELTALSSGSVSGKLVCGGTAVSFVSRIRPDVSDPNRPELFLNLPRMSLALTFDAEQQTFTGETDSNPAHPVTGWHNGWDAKANRATAFGGLHSFTLLQTGPADPFIPGGYGFGSFTVNEGTGAVKVTGKLPDGQTHTTTGFIGQQGQVLLFQPLYPNYQITAPAQGIFGGVFAVTPGATPADNVIASVPGFTPLWVKPQSPPISADRTYGLGFGPIEMEVVGGACPAPPAGGLVLNLPAGTANAKLLFNGGALSEELTQVLTLSNPSTNSLTNVATPFPPVISGLKVTSLNGATGSFRGEFMVAGFGNDPGRKAAFEGQIVRNGADLKGYGYFLLPQLPAAPGETAANVPILSGQVILEGNAN